MLPRVAKPVAPDDSTSAPGIGADRLADDLRQLFQTQVRTSPVPHDPSGVALRQARRVGRRRRAITVAATAATLFAVLGGAAAMHARLPSYGTYTVTYANLYGGTETSAVRVTGSLPVLKPQLDVWAGNQLWTADGRTLSLSGVASADEVIRVAAGWLYSEQDQLWLLPADPESSAYVVASDASAWAVSLDGQQLAVVTGDTTLRVESLGQGPDVSTAVPLGTTPVFLDGSTVVLSRAGAGFDHWSGRRRAAIARPGTRACSRSSAVRDRRCWG